MDTMNMNTNDPNDNPNDNTTNTTTTPPRSSFLTKLRALHYGHYDGAPIHMILQQALRNQWSKCEHNLFGANPFIYASTLLMLLCWLFFALGRTVYESVVEDEHLGWFVVVISSTSGMSPAFLLLLFFLFPPLYHEWGQEEVD